jgi:hypothetical protein
METENGRYRLNPVRILSVDYIAAWPAQDITKVCLSRNATATAGFLYYAFVRRCKSHAFHSRVFTVRFVNELHANGK